jgi:hypothetical protein
LIEAAELKLFKNIYSWLKPGGKLMIDCPEFVELENSWTKVFSEGTARGVSGFDKKTRIEDIQFYFKPQGEEEEFGIYDPYDLEKGDVPGIMRYLYTKSELVEILQKIGFETSEVEHYYAKNYFGFLATKK